MSLTLPKIATFVSEATQVEAAIIAGADHLILEDSKLCARSSSNDFDTPNFDNITQLAQLAKSLTPNIALSCHIDILIHHRHTSLVEQLVATAKQNGIHRYRIQDIGLIHLLGKLDPNAKLTLCTETGNLNWASMAHYAGLVQSQSFNHELPYQDMLDTQAKLAELGHPNYAFDTIVQGPILLQYSNRRYMAGNKQLSGETPASANNKAQIYIKLAKDHDHPNRLFPFLDNPHGHFMFAHFDRCLLKQIPKLMACQLNEWVIDARGQSLDYLSTSISAYKQAATHYAENPENHQVDESYINQLKTITNRLQLPGFFLSNKTDYELRKTIRMETKHQLDTLKAVIIDYHKGKWCALEVKHPISTKDQLACLTQENKLTELEPIRLESLEHQAIDCANPGDIVKLKWQKGMQPRALLY